MKKVHLTKASIPGVRYLREMKASTNKRRREATYASKIIVKKVYKECPNRRLSERSKVLSKKLSTREKSGGDRKAIPIRTAEQTRQFDTA